VPVLSLPEPVVVSDPEPEPEPEVLELELEEPAGNVVSGFDSYSLGMRHPRDILEHEARAN
jgi:hypothetical protein